MNNQLNQGYPSFQNQPNMLQTQPGGNPYQQMYWGAPQSTTAVQTPQNWNRPVTLQMSYPTVPGRAIMNPQEIKPNEVMMDGTPSLFPMNDYSCIYVKAWGADGTIKTVKFIPEQTATVEQQGPTPFDRMMERFDNLEKMLQNQGNRKPYYNKSKEDKKDGD